MSVSVSVAGPRGPTAPGVEVMLTMQFPPACTGNAVVQVVPDAIPKSAKFVPVIAGASEKVSGDPPLFVTMTDIGPLCVFNG